MELVDPFALVDDETVPDTLSEIFRLDHGPADDKLPVGDGLPVADGPPPDAEPPDAGVPRWCARPCRADRAAVGARPTPVRLAIWSVLGIVGLAILGVIIFVLVGRE